MNKSAHTRFTHDLSMTFTEDAVHQGQRRSGDHLHNTRSTCGRLPMNSSLALFEDEEKARRFAIRLTYR